MERVAILARGTEVGAADVAFLSPDGTNLAADVNAGGARDLASNVAAFERSFVLAALRRNGWKMSQTADELGLERSHLYKKLKALGIERE